jgi:hypothetical protein
MGCSRNSPHIAPYYRAHDELALLGKNGEDYKNILKYVYMFYFQAKRYEEKGEGEKRGLDLSLSR